MPTSRLLVNPMICSVVKRLLRMSVLRVDGLYCFTWYGSVGASHSRIELPIRWRLPERNKKPPAVWAGGSG